MSLNDRYDYDFSTAEYAENGAEEDKRNLLCVLCECLCGPLRLIDEMSDSKDTKHVTETPDTSYIKNVDVTHEVSDVYIEGIAKFVVALTALMVVSFVLMWALFRSFESRATDPPRSPMALSDQQRLPPEPRLQGAPGFAEGLDKSAAAAKEKKPEMSHESRAGAPPPRDPMWEIKVLRDQWDDVLKNGPLDKNGQRYGMPIEKAKEEVLKRGLPVREQKAEGSRQ